MNKEITLQISLKQIGAAAALLLFALSFWWFYSNPADEIERIRATSNINEQKKLYLQLIERVGPEEAQERLVKSGLPFTGQTHLLNHAVGEYLYKKFGLEGLTKCKEYFLGSCNHGFVISVISKRGLPAVSQVAEECRKAGPKANIQCAHAIGHGFLAYAGYKNLLEALKRCDKVGESSAGFPLFNCHDGVFMENIWGLHEGAPSIDRWVRLDDPLYPCNEPKIEEKYKNACWSNQPSLAYQLFAGDIKKVGEICLGISNALFRQTCFNGLARQIHPVAAGSVEKTLSMCGELPADWANYCIITNAASAFAVGDRTLPKKLCEKINDDRLRSLCNQNR